MTVGLPVSDLQAAVAWYRRAFELADPDVEPADGVVEFQLGPVWLQLDEGSCTRSGAETVLRVGVADAAGERSRLAELGVAVGELTHVEGAVDFFAFADPDGNQLSVYSLAPPSS